MSNVKTTLEELRKQVTAQDNRLVRTCIEFLNTAYDVIDREHIKYETTDFNISVIDKVLMFVTIESFVFQFSVVRDRKDRTSTVIHYSVDEHNFHDLKDIARVSFSSDDSFYRSMVNLYSSLIKIGTKTMEDHSLIRPWNDLLYVPQNPELEEDENAGLSAMLTDMSSKVRSMREFGTPFIVSPLVAKSENVEDFKFFINMVLNMLTNNENVETHDWLRDIDFELNNYVVNNELNKTAVKDALIWQLTNMVHDTLYNKRKNGDDGE